MGSSLRRAPNAALKASTRILSLVAWAVLYFKVARRRLRRSSLERPAQGEPALLDR